VIETSDMPGALGLDRRGTLRKKCWIAESAAYRFERRPALHGIGRQVRLAMAIRPVGGRARLRNDRGVEQERLAWTVQARRERKLDRKDNAWLTMRSHF
jgi:hypothetical protein